MSRPLRIEYPGAIYHVMNRGANKKTIFSQEEDRFYFLKVLGETVDLWKIKIHAYSLMDNHYHLLVETPLGNLSRALRHIDGVYTQRLNRKYNQDGPLFRGRYKSILVEKESYFLELVRYIHLNGVRALLYPHPRADFNSSHPWYLNPVDGPSWLTHGLALSYFGSDPVQRLSLFDAFVARGVSSDLAKILENKKWPALLGSPTFIDQIKKEFIEPNKQNPEKPQEKPLRFIVSPQEILCAVKRAYHVDERQIRTRNSNTKGARESAIYLLRHLANLKYSSIGQWMGGIKRSQISRICYRVKLSERNEVKTIVKKLLRPQGKGET